MRAIYYDTETTGVSSEKDRVIEIAAYDPLKKASFSHLLNPGILIPREATAIHGITDEMVKDKPSFKEIAADFINFCGDDAVLIAHNNDAFDIHFLRACFTLSEMTMPSWRFIDSLKWARRYRPDLPRHGLQALREHFGISANQAHRALDDVIILEKVFQIMIGDLSIETVHQLMSVQSKLTHMPFGKYQGKPLAEVPSDYVTWLTKSGAFEKPDNHLLKQELESLGLIK